MSKGETFYIVSKPRNREARETCEICETAKLAKPLSKCQNLKLTIKRNRIRYIERLNRNVTVTIKQNRNVTIKRNRIRYD
jgi:hypothetical protein